MLDYIRGMPDFLMVFTMTCMGFLAWVVIRLIPAVLEWVRRTFAYKYASLARENARLRNRLRKIQEENIRGRI